jgi:hypothetical protein
VQNAGLQTRRVLKYKTRLLQLQKRIGRHMSSAAAAVGWCFGHAQGRQCLLPVLLSRAAQPTGVGSKPNLPIMGENHTRAKSLAQTIARAWKRVLWRAKGPIANH